MGLIASDGYQRGYLKGYEKAVALFSSVTADPPNEDVEAEETELESIDGPEFDEEEQEIEHEDGAAGPTNGDDEADETDTELESIDEPDFNEDEEEIEHEDGAAGPADDVVDGDEDVDDDDDDDDDVGGDNNDDDDDDDHSEYHDAPEDHLHGAEDEVQPLPDSEKTPTPTSSPKSSPPPPTPPSSSPLATSSTTNKPKKEEGKLWRWSEKLALGKHMADVAKERAAGIWNTEQKWHEISSRMHDADNFDRPWNSCKNMWNRWGRKYFAFDERVRPRTDSLTTGIRNKPASKKKASEVTTAPPPPPSPSTETPYQPCPCGQPDTASGDMVACDGEHQNSWFHYQCVGLTAETLPSGSWYCHECVEAGYQADSDADNYEELPLALPDHAPQPKRKRDDKDEFDDEYGPDATETTSDTITLQSAKRIKA
ncbi:hypothetical protein MMC11_006788 [Xylographa trunciseda]|nr:hypothetical protein [Xylographa trunciseda]